MCPPLLLYDNVWLTTILGSNILCSVLQKTLHRILNSFFYISFLHFKSRNVHPKPWDVYSKTWNVHSVTRNKEISRIFSILVVC